MSVDGAKGAGLEYKLYTDTPRAKDQVEELAYLRYTLALATCT